MLRSDPYVSDDATICMQSDQATVVGGAIDYVKQLEQQLVALQAAAAGRRGGTGAGAAVATAASDGVFVSPQYASYSDSRGGLGAGVDVEATAAVGGHVRVRVAGRRWPGRLVRAVAALEDLRLAVLHLAVTSVGHDAVVYCFNLKVSEKCHVDFTSCHAHACPVSSHALPLLALRTLVPRFPPIMRLTGAKCKRVPFFSFPFCVKLHLI